MQILLAAVHTLSSIRLEEFSFQSRLFRSVTSTETPEIYANYTARRKKKQEKSSMAKMLSVCATDVPLVRHKRTFNCEFRLFEAENGYFLEGVKRIQFTKRQNEGFHFLHLLLFDINFFLKKNSELSTIN